MEQQFQLKFHCKYDLFEMDCLTAEERAWQIKRTDKEIQDINKRSQPGTEQKHHPNLH